MAVFNLEIITPEKRVFTGNVSAVKLPGTDGSFAVLSLHAPLISSLDKGIVEITQENGTKKQFKTQGGVVEVLNNKVIVLVERVIEEANSAV